MRYAIATGRAERDPAADLRGALKPYIKKHRPALTNPEKVGRLMHSIYYYTGSMVVRSALQLLALTFCRSGEIRFAEWREFDFDERLWRIPAERMKMRRDHLVPLSDQAVAILMKLREYSGANQYVFPSYYDESKPFGKTRHFHERERRKFFALASGAGNYSHQQKRLVERLQGG